MVSNGRLTSAGRNIKQSNATTDLCEPGAMRLERAREAAAGATAAELAPIVCAVRFRKRALR